MTAKGACAIKLLHPLSLLSLPVPSLDHYHPNTEPLGYMEFLSKESWVCPDSLLVPAVRHLPSDYFYILCSFVCCEVLFATATVLSVSCSVGLSAWFCLVCLFVLPSCCRPLPVYLSSVCCLCPLWIDYCFDSQLPISASFTTALLPIAFYCLDCYSSIHCTWIESLLVLTRHCHRRLCHHPIQQHSHISSLALKFRHKRLCFHPNTNSCAS